ncbi:MAG: CsoS2 family carboxysome shell protein [Chromatiales bacterium]|jgi:hypothetical protein
MANPSSQKSRGREAALARRQALSARGKQGLSSSASGTRRASAAPAEPQRRAQPARRSAAPSATSSTRAQAMARREALSRAGKKADDSRDRTRGETKSAAAVPAPAGAERKKEGCGCGCGGKSPGGCADKTGAAKASVEPRRSEPDRDSRSRGRRVNGKHKGSGSKPTGRLMAMARRSALSDRGKAASNASRPSPATLARQANPRLSGRELARQVREQRSRNGGAGSGKKESAGRRRVREKTTTGAADASWKVGASETSRGQTVTGTRVGRSRRTTGDEPSTCRNVTGTEYMGADIFREFCQAEPVHSPDKVRVSSTSHGMRVTGTEVGRAARVTGDEPGTCKAVTGTEYLSVEQQDAFCNTRPQPGPGRGGQATTAGGRTVSGTMVGRSARVTGDEPGSAMRPTGSQYTDTSEGKVPPKVGVSNTLGGGTVTGTRVGRSARVTGDEPGSCRRITGDEYADLDQYQTFCGTRPEPEARKVGHSVTGKHKTVSGTQTGRSAKVTGDEPGTCKAVTGTPYAGLEQYDAYCEPKQARQAEARTRVLASTPGPRMTGIQPGINGVMTGAERGACETLTGTPYVGQDQYVEACGGKGAAPGAPDFPRSMDGAPWQSFSVLSPAREAHMARQGGGSVTGTRYEQGQITGPFGMGTGKVTGTEQFRFDHKLAGQPDLLEVAPAEEAGPEKPRVTGEGQSAGSKITGDDWERGDRVTGTEGTSAMRRNPTRPGGPMGAMPPVAGKRNVEVPEPVSKVTGSSGSTERGAMVTYSGGARG